MEGYETGGFQILHSHQGILFPFNTGMWKWQCGRWFGGRGRSFTPNLQQGISASGFGRALLLLQVAAGGLVGGITMVWHPQLGALGCLCVFTRQKCSAGIPTYEHAGFLSRWEGSSFIPGSRECWWHLCYWHPGGMGLEHPGCAQLPTEPASGIRDLSAALVRDICSLLLC